MCVNMLQEIILSQKSTIIQLIQVVTLFPVSSLSETVCVGETGSSLPIQVNGYRVTVSGMDGWSTRTHTRTYTHTEKVAVKPLPYKIQFAIFCHKFHLLNSNIE